MGRVVPSREAVLASHQNVPKFGDLAKGDLARIMLFEFGGPNPAGSWSEFIHDLRAERIVEGDRIIRERQWFGTHVCLGNPAVLVEKGFDPDPWTDADGTARPACPACARAIESDAFKPARYHATNIIRYATKAGRYDLREPWSVDCLVWRFSERRFRELSDIKDQWGDMQQRDLLIECEVQQFQNYKIQVASSAAWLDPAYNPIEAGGTSPYGIDLKQLVAQTVKENKADDATLQAVCGTKSGPDTLLDRCNQLAAALGLGTRHGSNGASPTTVPGADLPASSGMSTDELNSLLGQPPAPAPAAVAQPAPDLGTREPQGAPAAAPAAPATPAVNPPLTEPVKTEVQPAAPAQQTLPETPAQPQVVQGLEDLLA